MIKKIFLIVLFSLFLAAPCLADEYWIYVRLEDRSGVTTDDDKGRSKAGDVVAALPVNSQNVPTSTEEKEYLIFKTDLTKEEADELVQSWDEGEGKDLITKAYRKNILDLDYLGIDKKKGLVGVKLNKNKIRTRVKTDNDLARYELERKFYAYLQRPLIRISNIITQKAFAENISTVNWASENYNTLTLWEDDKDGDLVTETRQETAELYDDDGELTDALSIDGSTTSSSYYMKVTAPVGERHNGTSGNGARIFTNTYLKNNIANSDDNTVIEWISMRMTSGTYRDMVKNNNTGFVIRHCVLKGVRTGNVGGGINISASGIAYDNIIFDVKGSGIYCYSAGGMNHILVNNTIYNGAGDGITISYSSGTTVGINNLCIGNAVDYGYQNSGSWDTFTTNGSTDATGSVGLTGLTTSEFVSVTGGSEDLHLAVGATSINAGTDAGSPYDYDIDNVQRTGSWDLGADEYVSTATARRMSIQ